MKTGPDRTSSVLELRVLVHIPSREMVDEFLDGKHLVLRFHHVEPQTPSSSTAEKAEQVVHCFCIRFHASSPLHTNPSNWITKLHKYS